jgi:hypothetical protein
MPLPFTKQWRENKKYRDILDKAITTFDAQYKLLKLTGKDIETSKGINIRALGYLNGFIKSAMDQQQLDLYNRNAFEVFRLLYEKIWGVELGKRYLEYWLNAMNENGDARALDFRFCASTGKQPMGWMSCFAGHEEAPTDV